jgi:hypothetical protein
MAVDWLTLGLLAKLDFSKIPNYNNVESFAKVSAFSPSVAHGIPTDFGRDGYVYRIDLVKEKPTSWADFYKVAPKYSGKITMIDIEELRDRGMLVAQLDVWRSVEKLCRDLAVSHELPFGHGSEVMTSVMLSVAKSSVRPERMAKELPSESYGIAYYKSYPRVMGYSAWDDVTQSGLVGDPTHATSEVGDEVVPRLTAELSQLLRDMAEAPIPTERSFQ